MESLDKYLVPGHVSIKVERNEFDHVTLNDGGTDSSKAPPRVRKPRYQCTLCHRRYTDKTRHMVVFHSAQADFNCGTCGSKFTTLKHLQTHERHKHKVKHILCPDCPASFYSNFHLRRHSKMHSSERPFACDTCGENFRLLNELMTHETKHSRTLTSIGLTKCLECGKGCHNLAVHMLQHVETRNFECDICQATFRSKENIRNHMNIHINARRYKCQQCGRDFNFRTQLSRHLRIHSEMCPFQCETCGKGFKFSGSLKLHRRSHTGEKPYKCERCEKAFTTVMSLQLHTRIHTGDKPYVCVTCGRGFHDGSTLKVHMRQHTGENPYACHICGKTTKQASNLKSHYRHFHKINDITSQVIRTNAKKALAEKRVAEEAAKQSQTTQDDDTKLFHPHEAMDALYGPSFFSSHSIAQLAKAYMPAATEETPIHKLTSSPIVPDISIGVCLNPKVEELEITVKEPIQKAITSKKVKTSANKPSKPTKTMVKIEETYYSESRQSDDEAQRRKSIETIMVKEEPDDFDWLHTEAIHVTDGALQLKVEKPYTDQDPMMSPALDHCWNNDGNDCNDDTDSITDASMVIEKKHEPAASFDESDTTPVDIKPLMSPLIATSPPPPNLPNTSTLLRSKANKSQTYQRCTICPKRFINYDEHMLRWHTVSPAKSFECKECHKMFRSNGNLQSHIVLHSNQKNVICEQCGAAFYFATDLRRHMRSHSDVRPFKCDLCEKSFKDLGQMRTHMRSHSGIKSHQCTQCEKTFVSTMGLQLHIRTHTGEKPYQCEYCGSAFADNSTYKQHLRIHTGERPYQCHLCGKGTTQAGNLKSHLRHFHKLIVKHVQMKKTK